MTQPVISVAVSCYNFDRYIAACLTSLATQECGVPFEIVVVDDCSTDESEQRILGVQAQYPDLIRFIAHPVNRGADATKQTACLACRGELIAFLDGDDLAYPGKLEAQYRYLRNNPDCILCYHDMDLIDAHDAPQHRTFADTFYNQNRIPEKAGMEHLVAYGTFLVASSQMFRHQAFRQGLLPSHIRCIGDFYYHIHSASLGRLGRLDQRLGAYRQHPESFCGLANQSTDRRWRALGDLLEACDYAASLGLDARTVARGKAHFRFAAAMFFLRRGHRDDFLRALNQSAADGCFFDARHEELYKLRHDPEAARLHLENCATA